MAKSEVEVIDRTPEYIKQVAALERFQLTVGFHQDKKTKRKEGGPSMAQVAYWNEFGTDDGRVPSRSFMRSTVDENRSKIADLEQRLVKNLGAFGVPKKEDLERVGLWLQAKIQEKIRSNIEPENADSVKARKEAKTRKGAKGGVKTLIDTGQMVQSVTFKVTIGGASKAAALLRGSK